MGKEAQAWFDASPLPEFFQSVRRRQYLELLQQHFWAEIGFFVAKLLLLDSQAIQLDRTQLGLHGTLSLENYLEEGEING